MIYVNTRYTIRKWNININICVVYETWKNRRNVKYNDHNFLRFSFDEMRTSV